MWFYAQVRPSFSALPYYWSHKEDSLLAPQTQPISIPNQIFHHKKCSMAIFQISFNGHFIFKVLSAKSPGSPLPPTWHIWSVSRFSWLCIQNTPWISLLFTTTISTHCTKPLSSIAWIIVQVSVLTNLPASAPPALRLFSAPCTLSLLST